ncbi:hypothetical protein PF001_g17526 [Phytophthora fragariae]|uniref:Uncharacterized protein n=1 Tax=Phytophthora fragariae TaxID=53985 RepID=A0A6A4CQT5_9STRA|nr:hypothetical protein PF001_g17526 [Phytophthora fragariae]
MLDGFGYSSESRTLTVLDTKKAFKSTVMANNSYTRDTDEDVIPSSADDLRVKTHQKTRRRRILYSQQSKQLLAASPKSCAPLLELKVKQIVSVNSASQLDLRAPVGAEHQVHQVVRERAAAGLTPDLPVAAGAGHEVGQAMPSASRSEALSRSCKQPLELDAAKNKPCKSESQPESSPPDLPVAGGAGYNEGQAQARASRSQRHYSGLASSCWSCTDGGADRSSFAKAGISRRCKPIGVCSCHDSS